MVGLHVLVEDCLVGAWDEVPGLGVSVVVIVDRMDVKVLNVPAEGGELHACVHPRLGDSADAIFF